MPKAKFTVKSRLDLDNRLYEPAVEGRPPTVVELDEETAAPLLACGAVEPAPAEAAPSKGQKK